ncbi:MAG: alpha/beta hydrolase [Pseudomonadales bacterium]
MSTIVKDIGAEPDSAVIWLHGLGAHGSDFVPALPYLQLPEQLSVRFVFPSAPVRPVTVNSGMPMPSWYDILEMLPARKVCERELSASVTQVTNVIDDLLAQGITRDRIVLVGFSQGGALAYQCALVASLGIDAVAAMSTYIPLPEKVALVSSSDEKHVLIIHGSEDGVVPIEMGKAAHVHLQGLGYTPTWREFTMEHQVNEHSLRVLGQWISNYLET